MDIEFNPPEPPSYEERELDEIRTPVDDGGQDGGTGAAPPLPAWGRTPGSAEGERDPADQSR